MIDLNKYLYDKIKKEIAKWDEDGIYAISFFIYSNEAHEYKGFRNVTEFHISYNTEDMCSEAGELDEERWNYAFWIQDEIPIFEASRKNKAMDLLFQWYEENGITNIGYEDDDCYNENCEYIGKGPVGYSELLKVAKEVARQLQKEGYIKAKFGKPLPIILHGLEYCHFTIEATKHANPDGEAEVFLRAMEEIGCV